MGCFGRSSSPSVSLVVRDSKNRRKLIKTHSFDEFLTECRRIYEIPDDCEVCVYDEDGTEIDDSECLLALQPYTVLCVLRKGEHQLFFSSSVFQALTKFETALNADSQKLLESIRDAAPALVNALARVTATSAHQLQQGGSSSSGYDAGSAQDSPKDDGDRALLDSRTEDPKWFEVIRAAKAQSKKEVLRENAKRRIKGYYYKTKEDLMKAVPRPLVEYVFNDLMQRLREADFNSAYFERGHKQAFCCSRGWFGCEGAFDQANCTYGHRVNPYAKPENYLIFSTWNLDHQVERSRTVLPSLRDALLSKMTDLVNVAYFYDLLFTRVNLRLVHVVCHLKTAHTGLDCDPKHVFRQNEQKNCVKNSKSVQKRDMSAKVLTTPVKT